MRVLISSYSNAICFISSERHGREGMVLAESDSLSYESRSVDEARMSESEGYSQESYEEEESKMAKEKLSVKLGSGKFTPFLTFKHPFLYFPNTLTPNINLNAFPFHVTCSAMR